MSKNRQTADLINYISVNGSGDIVMTGNIIMPGGSQAATESYVTTAISNLVNAAPTALDTLAELSTALNNDASFATTVTNSLASKLALSGGTLTGQLNGTSAVFSGAISGTSGSFNGSVRAVNLYNLYKSDNTTLGAQLAYDSSINQLYLWNNVSNGYFSIYLNGNERFKIAADSTVSLNGSTTVRQNLKVLGDTYTSVELLDGGTGDPGYIYLYYNGTKYFSIGANDTYFNYGNVAIGSTVADNTYQGLTLVGSNPSVRLKTTQSNGWVWTEYVTASGVNNFSMGVNQTLPYFGIKSGAGMDSPSFAVLSNGNICINTVSDNGQKLQVLGTSYFSGVTTIGQTSPNGGINGIYFRPGIESGFIVTSDVALQLSRLGTVGDIQTFYSGTTRVGKISVGGSTVTLESANNGGILVASTGKVGVGGNASIYSRLNVEGSTKINRSIYNWYQAGWQGNGTYWHMKTNMYGGAAGNTMYTMSLFKGYMYSYGSVSALEGTYGFHNWSGTIYSAASSGNLFTTAYVSSDGYVVLVVPSGSGETGVTIDWHQAYGYPFVEATVTHNSLHGSPTGRY